MSTLPSTQPAVAALERARLRSGAAWALACACVDALMLLAAVAATLLGSHGTGVAVMPAAWLLGFGALVLGLAWMRGLYQPRLRLELVADLRRVVAVTSLATASILAMRVVLTDASVEAAEVLRPWAFATAYLAAGRAALCWSQHVSVRERPAGLLVWDEAEAVASRAWEALGRRLRGNVARGRGWLVRRALVLSDVGALVLAFLIPQSLLAPAGSAPVELAARTEFLLFLLAVPLWVLAAKAYGLYKGAEERTDYTTLDDVPRVVHVVTLGAWLFFAGTWAIHIAEPDFARLALFWIVAITLIVLSRSLVRGICRRSVLSLQNAVIVGAGEVGQLVARKFVQHPEYRVNVVGFVDDAPRERLQEVGHLALLGSPDGLPDIVRAHGVDRVVVAFSNDAHAETLSLIRSLRDLDVQIDIVPRLFEVLGPSATLHGVGGVPLVGLPPLRLSHLSRALKRTLDLALSGLGLAVLAPISAVLALAIKLTSPGPVIFRQTRMGAGDRTFEMFKFRTMTEDADQRKTEFAHLNKHNGGDPRMFKIANDPRVTPVGRFLRSTSLDELPQLVNVLRGEMTLVGPRPLILEEDQHVSEWARRRLDLKPGITGPWQTLGRNEIPFEEMIKLDYLYVTNWSAWRDIKLMLQTIPAVIRSRSVVY